MKKKMRKGLKTLIAVQTGQVLQVLSMVLELMLVVLRKEMRRSGLMALN